MSCEYKEHPEQALVELIVEGRVTEADFDAITGRLAEFIARHGKIKVLEIVKSFDGVDLAAIPKGVMFDIRHLSDFSHCAVVTDSGWIGPFTRAMAPFFSVDIRVFPLGGGSGAAARRSIAAVHQPRR